MKGSHDGSTSSEPERLGALWRVRFRAMASPCELLIDGGKRSAARRLGARASAEALRIEAKYSRYRESSALQRINTARGRRVDVDAETSGLLDWAGELHAASDGRFDVTSGVLREAWRFDGSDRVPTAARVATLLGRIGWERVGWRAGASAIALPADMQIDFGGLGKEYAVDRTLALLSACTDRPLLVNFGGDLAANAPPASGAWSVGVERPDGAPWTLPLRSGALASSGDARRYLLKGGVRYGHVLDPRTGWPVVDAPRSVTVAADTCSAAGALATLALLRGAGAEVFLAGQGVRSHCERDDASLRAPEVTNRVAFGARDAPAGLAVRR